MQNVGGNLVVPTLTGKVSWGQTIQVRQYEPATAHVELEVSIPFSDDAEEVGKQTIIALREAFAQAKLVVLEQLGIDSTFTEAGVVVEVMQRAFPGSTQEPVDAPPSTQEHLDKRAQLPAGTVSATPPHPVATRDEAEKTANAKWALARVTTHPDEFYDNRGENTNRPPLKHKPSGLAVWKEALKAAQN